MDAAELDLFDRSIRQATATSHGADLDQALADLGWGDALAQDRASAVAVLFENLGAANVSSAALSQLMATTLGLGHDTGSVLLLPVLRRYSAPAQLVDQRWAVHGLGEAETEKGESTLVVGERDGSHVAIKVATAGLSLRRIAGLDPERGLVEVTGEFDQSATQLLGPVDWTESVSVCQLALSHELIGAARTMLELARTHALSRVQFGRPIATFQAVRHRLADCLVALEAAAAVLDAAWESPSPVVAAMAKATSGRAARTVTRNCQQVLAGVGFTTEHDFHRYVRRTMVLDQLFGAGTALTAGLGAEVARTGLLPPSLEL